MKTPLISVVLPIYNIESYLDRCMKAVLNQTYSNLEILMVDDGSPDNSPAITASPARAANTSPASIPTTTWIPTMSNISTG